MIDQVHKDWPEVAFVLRMPSGERVLVPRHRPGMSSCGDGHQHYFSANVDPFCAEPLPRRGGPCELRPVAGSDGAAVPSYSIDLGSGEITAAA